MNSAALRRICARLAFDWRWLPCVSRLTLLSPASDGTDSRSELKLSLMWSRRLRSSALWWARFSACEQNTYWSGSVENKLLTSLLQSVLENMNKISSRFKPIRIIHSLLIHEKQQHFGLLNWFRPFSWNSLVNNQNKISISIPSHTSQYEATHSLIYSKAHVAVLLAPRSVTRNATCARAQHTHSHPHAIIYKMCHACIRTCEKCWVLLGPRPFCERVSESSLSSWKKKKFQTVSFNYILRVWQQNTNKATAQQQQPPKR